MGENTHLPDKQVKAGKKLINNLTLTEFQRYEIGTYLMNTGCIVLILLAVVSFIGLVLVFIGTSALSPFNYQLF
jgi:hypothetical protein